MDQSLHETAYETRTDGSAVIEEVEEVLSLPETPREPTILSSAVESFEPDRSRRPIMMMAIALIVLSGLSGYAIGHAVHSSFRSPAINETIAGPQDQSQVLGQLPDDAAAKLFDQLRAATAPVSPEARARALVVKGDQLFSSGSFIHAGLAYKNALKLDPKNVQARLSLALCLLKLHRPDVAERELQRGRDSIK